MTHSAPHRRRLVPEDERHACVMADARALSAVTNNNDFRAARKAAERENGVPLPTAKSALHTAHTLLPDVMQHYQQQQQQNVARKTRGDERPHNTRMCYCVLAGARMPEVMH